MAFTSFEHLLLKKMRQDGMQGAIHFGRLFGGVDSVVLLGTLNQLSKPLGIKIRAIHIHHGHVRLVMFKILEIELRNWYLIFVVNCKFLLK